MKKGLQCSFCGRWHSEVATLIPGPGDIFICDSCVDVCKSVVDNMLGKDRALPERIKEFRDCVTGLRALLDMKEITQAEFDAKRKKLLEQLWKT